MLALLMMWIGLAGEGDGDGECEWISNGKYINEKSCRVSKLFVVLFNCTCRLQTLAETEMS